VERIHDPEIRKLQKEFEKASARLVSRHDQQFSRTLKQQLRKGHPHKQAAEASVWPAVVLHACQVVLTHLLPTRQHPTAEPAMPDEQAVVIIDGTFSVVEPPRQKEETDGSHHPV
jgi:hypothetical protein